MVVPFRADQVQLEDGNLPVEVVDASYVLYVDEAGTIDAEGTEADPLNRAVEF